MFSRFGPAARRILRVAEQECRNHNHFYVGAEHMLYALLEEHDPAVDDALTREQCSPSDIHAKLKRAMGMGDDRMWEGILLTPRVRRIVTRAEEIAGSRPVEPLDILLAIRCEGGMAAELLEQPGS